MPEGSTMTSADWRKWADGVLSRPSIEMMTLFDGLFGFGPWGTHYDSSEVRALYAYFIAEFIDTEGSDV